MSDQGMTPAVRRALGLAPKSKVNYDKKYDKKMGGGRT